MNILSFSFIVTILFIALCVHLITSDSVDGRPKMLVTFCLGLLVIILFMNLSVFKSYTEILTTTVAAESNDTVVTASKMPRPTANFSISTWIFINDWNYQFGNTKNILQLVQNGATNPISIDLDTYEPNLIIKYNTKANSSSTINQQTVSIPGISIQKWVNIVVCFSDTKVDTYINGKLVDTNLNPNAIYFDPLNAGDFMLNVGNSYNGSTSLTNYYDYFLSPSQVWKIYQAGYATDMFGNFLSKYKAAFTFYKDDQNIAQLVLSGSGISTTSS